MAHKSRARAGSTAKSEAEKPVSHKVASARSVAPRSRPTPLAVDVLVIGNSTRTIASLNSALQIMDLSCRVTSVPDDVLGLSAKDLPSLILVDDEAAGFDAISFVKQTRSSPRLREIPVVLLSSVAETRRKVEAFSAGVVDYICLPVDSDELVARVLTHIRLRRAQLESEQHSRRLEAFVLEQVSEITDSQMATIIALAKLAESRDDQTGGHLERVQQNCRLLASKLSEQTQFGIIDHTFIDNIEYASALHDIGKVAISDTILLKPTELTEDEFEQMKMHTVLGAQTLEAVNREYPNSDFIEMGIKIARWHHERWDGGGYPDGLAGEAIPLPARIMAVADVYDALTSQRSYKGPLPHSESREIIVTQSGLQFDPNVVDAFVSVHDQFVRSISD